MKYSAFIVMAFCLAFLIAFPATVLAGEEMYEGSRITTDNSSRITSISYSNPQTYLGIEAEFLFTVAPDAKPTNGSITFKNGVQRGMNPGELALLFAQCGGPNTVWDYYKEHGKTVSYFPGNDKIPFDVYGKTCRLVLNDGRQFIGKLAKMQDKPDGFSLAVDGACCGPLQFYNNTVKEIQQMK